MVEYLNAMSGPETSTIAVEYSRLTQGSRDADGPNVRGGTSGGEGGVRLLCVDRMGHGDLPGVAGSERTCVGPQLPRVHRGGSRPRAGVRRLPIGKPVGRAENLRYKGEGDSERCPCSTSPGKAHRWSSTSSPCPGSSRTKDDWTAESAVYTFLDELSSIPGLTDVGENLRASGPAFHCPRWTRNP